MIHLFRRSTATSQADRLRSLVEDNTAQEEGRLPGPPIVVVAGSKGGVGTTSIAWSIATAFSKIGKRCVAVDANLRQANLGHVARTPLDGGASIADVLSGEVRAEAALVFAEERLWLLPGAWAPETHPQCTPEGAERLIESLAGLRDTADVLVVDAGAGHTPMSAPLWERAAEVLLVATSDPLAILGAYASVKLARADNPGCKINLLINRAETHEEGAAAHAAIGQTCQRFLGQGLPLGGVVGEGDLRDGSMRVAHRVNKLIKNKKEPAPELAAA